MSDRDPERKNPLSPYVPTETPDVPGNGRTWFAVLLAALLVLSAAVGFLALVSPP